jgi:hypothetical protein
MLTKEEFEAKRALIGRDWTDYNADVPEPDWLWMCSELSPEAPKRFIASFVTIEKVHEIVRSFLAAEGDTVIYCEPHLLDEVEMYRDEASWIT